MLTAMLAATMLLGSFQNDTIKTRNGESITIGFLGHASLAFEIDGKIIYVDPVGMFADYSKAPKADVILITHDHGDHLDSALIETLSKKGTQIIGNAVSIDMLGRGEIMKNGDSRTVDEYLKIEAVPAYNTTAGHTEFHPKGGRDNGYILTLGGTRIYVSGDSELTDEMKALKNIDIAFLPVNQPYTMTVDQAVAAAKAISPTIFYPYHTGQTDTKTDLDRLIMELKDTGIDVRVKSME